MIRFRDGIPSEAESIGLLHARSWQVHYKGILTPKFLDGPVLEDRQTLWEKRLQHLSTSKKLIVALQDHVLVGMAYTHLHADSKWGSLLDNLHVAPESKGKGIGRALFWHSWKWVADAGSTAPFWLWVLEENTQAIGFYERLGGQAVERTIHPLPDGGQAWVLRYVWEKSFSISAFQKATR